MRQIGDQFDPAGREVGREVARNKLVDPRPQRFDAPWRERGTHDAADLGVVRRVGLGHAHGEVLVERREPARRTSRASAR